MLNSRLWERRRALVCVTADTWSALKSEAAIPGSWAEGNRAHSHWFWCKRCVANTRKQVKHQIHMTKTNSNGKLLLTKIFGGLIRLSWCRYICLSYCANLSRTQLENASQKLHAIWLISTKLPSLCLSWMGLFPEEWQQLGFISPSYWNSFRGRRGRRTVNSSFSFRLFPSSGRESWGDLFFVL